MLLSTFKTLFLAGLSVTRSTLSKRVSGTSVVNLGNNTGTPNHLASGVLYGIPDAKDQIPDHFYANMGFKYARGGGAQVPAPGRGWVYGIDEYNVRFASALSNYQTARQHGANFVFLIHDLWGADGSSISTWPGDNGNWTSWDDYLTTWIADMNANDATDGLLIDIWNEPDGSNFWGATQDQYLEMWGRTYARLRAAWPSVLLTGPASAGEPSSSWWVSFAAFVAANGSIPDQWVWHMESGGGDMESTYGALVNLLAEYDLPMKPININEYGVFDEQTPPGSAWWISQLERINAIGLRGNWLSGWELHDFLASLLSKPNADTSAYSNTSTGYFPNGDYQVYQYYNLNMTGYRVGTSPSADLLLDTYATVSPTTVKILSGVRLQTGTWQITVNDLSVVGLPTSGNLSIHTWQFDESGGKYAEVDGPTDLGYVSHAYEGDSVTFPVFQTDTYTTWAFEFAI